LLFNLRYVRIISAIILGGMQKDDYFEYNSYYFIYSNN